MGNLKKREIIILVIAGLFVLYAVYEYLLADRLFGKKAHTGTSPARIEKVANTMSDDLAASRLSELDRYIIQRASLDWEKSPFLGSDLYRAWMAKDGTGPTASGKFVYSGFIESGKSRLAIINRVEYRVGEELIEEGYVLKQITSSKVVIYDKNTGNNFEIPMQE
jgi:hypothetical protein